MGTKAKNCEKQIPKHIRYIPYWFVFTMSTLKLVWKINHFDFFFSFFLPPSFFLSLYCSHTGSFKGMCKQIDHFPEDADYEADASEYFLRESSLTSIHPVSPNPGPYCVLLSIHIFSSLCPYGHLLLIVHY